MVDAYIFDALRTPRGKGKQNGALHEVRAVELLTAVLRTMQERHNLDTSQVDDGIFGCVTPIEDQGGNIAKTADYNQHCRGLSSTTASHNEEIPSHVRDQTFRWLLELAGRLGLYGFARIALPEYL